MRLTVNGTKMFVDVEGAKFVPDGDTMREKPTIVLLHGGPGFDHSQFKPQFSQLADVAQLVYLDHRGCGRSDRDDPNSWTLETWADDVKGVCDALEIERPIVLGWSFGGFVAMAYAARYPGHAEKLILQSTAARLDVDVIAAAFESVGGAEAAAIARAFWTSLDNETMVAYLQRCIPLYHPGPLDPAVLSRCLLNVDLLMGFDGEKEMDHGKPCGGSRSPSSSWPERSIRSLRWRRPRRSWRHWDDPTPSWGCSGRPATSHTLVSRTGSSPWCSRSSWHEGTERLADSLTACQRE